MSVMDESKREKEVGSMRSLYRNGLTDAPSH